MINPILKTESGFYLFTWHIDRVIEVRNRFSGILQFLHPDYHKSFYQMIKSWYCFQEFCLDDYNFVLVLQIKRIVVL